MVKVSCMAVFMIFSLTAFGQDWPNLSRFQQANALLGEPAAGEKRIVLMGNSITEGWSGNDLPFIETHQLINRGIGGQTTPQMLLRFRQDVIDLQPAAVFILAGINDLAGNTGPSNQKMIRDNITSMAMLAKAAGIRVFLCSILPSNRIPWKDNMNPSSDIQELNSWIEEFALKSGFNYVDYYSKLADAKHGLPEKYSQDGVHPNIAGYKEMEKVIVPFIQQIRQ